MAQAHGLLVRDSKGEAEKGVAKGDGSGGVGEKGLGES
jgi:hypothetical protein